jgi:hypothetical protein
MYGVLNAVGVVSESSDGKFNVDICHGIQAARCMYQRNSIASGMYWVVIVDSICVRAEADIFRYCLMLISVLIIHMLYVAMMP